MTERFTGVRDWLDAPKDWAPLFIRLVVGIHLILGTQDNVLSWSRMLEFRDFLALQGFPLPLVSAVVSVAAQFLAGVCYLLGWFTRPAAAVMVVNFLVAILAVHLGDTWANTFPALTMLAGSLFLLFNGPGRPSIDARRG